MDGKINAKITINVAPRVVLLAILYIAKARKIKTGIPIHRVIFLFFSPLTPLLRFRL